MKPSWTEDSVLKFYSMGSWLGLTPVKNAKIGAPYVQMFKESRMRMAMLWSCPVSTPHPQRCTARCVNDNKKLMLSQCTSSTALTAARQSIRVTEVDGDET